MRIGTNLTLKCCSGLALQTREKVEKTSSTYMKLHFPDEVRFGGLHITNVQFNPPNIPLLHLVNLYQEVKDTVRSSDKDRICIYVFHHPQLY